MTEKTTPSQDLKMATAAIDRVRVAVHEFHIACQDGQFSRAEALALEAAANTEVHLDLMLQAARKAALMNKGK
jgi:hypothetical protein